MKIYTLHVWHLPYLNNDIDNTTVHIESQYVRHRIHRHRTKLLCLQMSLLSTAKAQLSEHSSGIITHPEPTKIQESNTKWPLRNKTEVTPSMWLSKEEVRKWRKWDRKGQKAEKDGCFCYKDHSCGHRSLKSIKWTEKWREHLSELSSPKKGSRCINQWMVPPHLWVAHTHRCKSRRLSSSSSHGRVQGRKWNHST